MRPCSMVQRPPRQRKMLDFPAPFAPVTRSEPPRGTSAVFTGNAVDPTDGGREAAAAAAAADTELSSRRKIT